MREVAVWRSYVYAVNQIGRAAGPPLGGIISDLTDWRWYVLLRDSLFKAKTIRSLLLQVPFNVLGILLIWRTMKLPGPKPEEDSRKGEQDDTHPQVNRIDFLGALSLGFANTFLLLFLDRMQSSFEVWKDTFARATAGACITFAMTFVLVEAYWAREPILPLRLILRRNVLSSYLIQFSQTAAQMAVGFSDTNQGYLTERTGTVLYLGSSLLPYKSRRFQFHRVDSSSNHHDWDHTGWAHQWLDRQAVRFRCGFVFLRKQSR
jgi:MFS family permease